MKFTTNFKKWLGEPDTPAHVRHQGTQERFRRLRQISEGKLTGGASNPTFTALALPTVARARERARKLVA